jgi:N,N-dimethylformamidase
VDILAYCDRFSVSPGEAVALHLSSALPRVAVDVVRLTSIDDRPEGPGWDETPVQRLTAEARPSVQDVHAGSYAVAAGDLLASADRARIEVWAWPTTPEAGRQTLVTGLRDGQPVWSLGLDDDGHAVLRVGGDGAHAVARSEAPLRARSWYRIAAEVDAAAGALTLVVEDTSPWVVGERLTVATAQAAAYPTPLAADRVYLAARPRPGSAPHAVTDRYNGKLEAPRISIPDGSGWAPVAAWDFAQDMAGDRIVDVSGHGHHGTCVNMPARAMTGHAWSGHVHRARSRPEEYGAIHFHDDDLEDARWAPLLSYTVPDELPSGVYAFKVTAGETTEHFPFWVTPGPGGARQRVAFLASTNTYLAYGNERLAEGGRGESLALMKTAPVTLDDADRYRFSHHELGGSLYDVHSDGSGVCYSSRLRPILNLRPSYRTWLNDGPRNFAADFYVLGWLHHLGVDHDVLTDEDLHRDGAAALADYDLVVTGSHPEYYTAEMLDAHQAHLAAGGNLMYLGGNGFYWVTSMGQDRPHVIESRRSHAGTRNWNGGPGEDEHSLSGRLGGIWRHVGRPPQQLVGTGFTAFGWGQARGYTRTPESYAPSVAHFFAGIENTVIGERGLVLGGAAGDELDRADAALGTPAHAVVLARSDNEHRYVPVIEDHLELMPDRQTGAHEDVRADLVYFETGAGGAVLSASSICWAGALAWNKFDNDVSTLCANVLRSMTAHGAS